MPSPVITSHAAAASPTNSVRAVVGTTVSTRAGMGHARCGSSATTSGPSTARMWGRPRRSGHSCFMSWMEYVPPRWIPKPMLARPSGNGNDQK